MKRSAIAWGTSTLKRSPISRTGILSSQSFARTKIEAADKPARKGLKRGARPRMTPIRKAAKGQDCTLRFPGCDCGTETTVLCHSNFLADGKGMGLKVPDTCAAFGCAWCHDILDGRAPRPGDLTYEAMVEVFYAAVKRTHTILKRMDLLPEQGGQP